ncbi:LPXTG-motif cell wall anchor domain-containing protein/conserved repeat domain-containing protein [Tindallia magadiensis]|uniref:LPXTG-motif cell wall anchor domain-containing protein/conserved repeat domain-containing protein n=1 Tax=Tindallia magadiensis TaxID=69895 RepID=A0A1I3CV08_9FIRM|nr:SpaA isopeptide-forming pilin-related protein [Tindallia magadiensis]SFH78081.1 LPXTG-motif cell wall anchor domain-containing protein/conserved repeat domain-containing protein [Tindallia magadiensis]
MKFTKRKIQSISVLLVLFLLLPMFGQILPEGWLKYFPDGMTVTADTYGSGSVTDAVYGDQFITDIRFTKPGGPDDLSENLDPLEEPVSKDAEFRITYYFEIPNTMDVKEGESFTITIPEEIQKINNQFEAPLNDDNGNTIANATYYTDNRVEIIFTDYVENEGLGDISGYFWIQRRFEESAIGNEGETDIIFDLNGESTFVVTVVFETMDEETHMGVNKSNSYSAENNEITWIVTITPSTSPTSNLPIENVVFKDVIEDNQNFVDDSLTITSNIAGWISDDKVTVILPDTGNNNELKIEFNEAVNTETDEEYTITFKTNPDISGFAAEGDSVAFENTAVVEYRDVHSGEVESEEDSSTRNITANFIQKFGSYNQAEKRIDWTITINNNYFEIPAGAEIIDEIPEGLTLLENSIRLDDGGPLTINNDDGPLKYNQDGLDPGVEGILSYTFEEALTGPHTLTYSTEVTDEDAYTSNDATTFTNKASLEGTGLIEAPSIGVGVDATTNIIRKTSPGFDAANQEITWQIVVNENEIEIENPVVTDTIPDGLVYVENSFAVNGDQTNTGFDYDEATNTFTYDFEGIKDGDHKIHTTYTLTFKTRAVNNTDYAVNKTTPFINRAVLTGENIETTEDTATRNYISRVIQKDGVDYDYVEKIVTWRIRVNHNEMEMTNARVEDVIEPGFAFIPGSVTINNAPATERSGVGEGYEYDEDTKKLTYHFPGTINTLQEITFQTEITDLSIFETNGPINAENTATLFGDEIPSDNVSDTGTQEIVRTLVEKIGNYENGDSYIEWDVVVNRDQLEISNPVLTDELQEGLELDTATIQLNHLTIASDGSYTIGDEVPLEAENIEYNPGTREFTFRFNQDIDSAYLLRFQTDIASGYHNATFSNEIQFAGSHGEESSTSSSIQVEVQTVGGGASGSNGSITVTKIDENNTSIKLQGAVFQLYDRFGMELGESKETDVEGEVLFDSLKFDIPYTVKEVTPPEGYYMADGQGEYTFTLTSGDKDITYTFENSRITGNIQFQKVDADTENSVEGAVFNLYESSDENTVIATATSDEDGLVTFENVGYGNYVIKEDAPATGYLITEETLEANVSEKDVTVFAGPAGNEAERFKLENQVMKGSLQMTKVDAEDNNRKLEGATFELFRKSGDIFVSTGITVMTDENGFAEITDLPYGDYILREITAPDGYYLSSEDQNFKIESHEEIVVIEVENDKIPEGNLVINKLDALSKIGIPGVEFEVYNQDGDLVTTITTDGDGMAEAESLFVGTEGEFATYTLKESVTPDGYHPSEEDKIITIEEGTGNAFTIENQPYRGLEIIKIDSRDETRRLEGAIFSLYRKNGINGDPIREEKITDENGKLQFESLEFGEYLLRETQAPSGYRLNSEVMEILIDEESPGTISIEWPNTRRPTGGGGGGTPQTPEPETPGEETEGQPETPSNPPTDGTIEIPEADIPLVIVPPENGTVEIDEDGNWTYTPDPGYNGKDRFTVRIIREDGTEEEVVIEIDPDPIPEGGILIPDVPELPQTGESHPAKMIILGLLLSLIGIILNQKFGRKRV